MKTLNFLTFLTGLLLSSSLVAQPFEMAYHGPAAHDYQHYSIETTPGGDYVLAGTIYDHATGQTDIHLLKIDAVGNNLWEVSIDYMGFDDAALDVVVDPAGDIVLTGYVSNSPNFPEMYVAKYDPAGGFMGDHIINGFPTAASAGTNIMFSNQTGTYIVGGFHHDPPVNYPLLSGEAVVIELDPALNPINTTFLSTPGGPSAHSSINDIVEINGFGYFVTGTYESSGGSPSVMAVLLDPALGMINDLSFNDGSYRDQAGVSALYDAPTDHIYLVSNHDITANPQIRVILGASGGGVMGPEFDLNIFDNTFTQFDGSAFEIMDCPWNPADLVIAGRFKNGPTGGTDNNVWLLQYDKAGLGFINGMFWDVTSPNYENYGLSAMTPLFSTWVGSHPYMYNEEIVTFRPDMLGVTIVAPTDILAPYYGIDVVTTNQMNALGCYEVLNSSIVATSSIYEPIMWTPAGLGAFPPGITGTRSTGQDWNCLDPTLPRGPLTGDGTEDADHQVAGIDTNGDVELNISPNPSNAIFNIRFNSEMVNGNITIMNTVGQIVYRSENITTTQFTGEIDLSEYKNGVYILQLENGSQLITKKLIKK